MVKTRKNLHYKLVLKYLINPLLYYPKFKIINFESIFLTSLLENSFVGKIRFENEIIHFDK